MKHVEFYRNEKDNSILAVVGVQAEQEIVVDGQKLVRLVADSVDAAKEKHVPAVRKEDGRLVVEVGSVTHPMEEKHYIEWIALVSDKSVDIRYLNPGEAPKAEFEGNSGVVYAYCNLHGLWKTEV
ncbi:desulfoferrodoxin family protein [Megasphaera stantonii]|uniref:desulfoferrodoxin family protein n=1 Tax=Megasphaera stantonii TaxID=2144175 RepID=UPI00195EE47C|nr:desulfoferrodoxin family protein [Megasphaera stantonii]MBM6731950.1 desulfoferrodoxin [Megasphaera stantonii]